MSNPRIVEGICRDCGKPSLIVPHIGVCDGCMDAEADGEVDLPTSTVVLSPADIAAGWRSIESAPRDLTEMIVAVPSKARGGHIVSAAYFDPKAYDGSWWWCGTSHDDYGASCIEEGNDGPPVAWQPFPPTLGTPSAVPGNQPCGHCGSSDIFVEREDLCAYQTHCNGCGARGPIVEQGNYIQDDGRGQEAAFAAWNRRLQPAPALVFPAELTPALRDALGMMNFQTGPIAHALRANGADIERRIEAEQAHVLHWFVQLALQHGEGWRKVVGAELRRQKAQGGEAHG